LKYCIPFLLIVLPSILVGQKKNENYRYNITKIDQPIEVDGLDNEEIWKQANVAKDFHMIWPMDTSMANIKTEVKMMYDDKNIYLYAVNYIPIRKYTVESLRRDWSFLKNDNFEFVIDTYNDITNGFIFGVNSAGAQLEAQQYDGGPSNPNWDNIWYSEVKQYDDHWTVEAAIPFKSIRFNKELTTWGINFSRNDLFSTEKSSWAPVPRQFPSISSAFTGTLVWPAPPPSSKGTNISMIPYVLSGVSKNYSPNKPADIRTDVGFDTKVSLGSALNLDLTVNPDFSQVEVDRQQTNLDRFELFFPERRQFFLENDDLFNNLGMERIRPFFSRRIGLGVPIQYGARVSGKLNKNLRLGAMNIQTGQDDSQSINGQNFTVLSLQQKVFSRSNITAFMVNKDELQSEKFHRNLGVEYNMQSKNNRWRGKLMYHHADNQAKLKNTGAIAGNLNYQTRNWNISTQLEKVDQNFTADVGFYQRNNYVRTTNRIGYTYLPKGTNILSHGPSLFHFGSFIDNSFSAQEHTYGVMYGGEFRTRANFSMFAARDYIQLSNDFDPTNFTGIKVKAGTIHKWYAYGLNFNSKPQSPFTYGIESRFGTFYSEGRRTRIAANLSYRIQPYAQIALAAEVNDITFPEDSGLKDAKFYLVGPRVDVTLTNNFYFTTFIQYNEQIKNTNINARLQWRYKPVSDIYLVFTDNYDINTGNVKNRAIVLKANYWWNI
jgi:hypothetical protein